MAPERGGASRELQFLRQSVRRRMRWRAAFMSGSLIVLALAGTALEAKEIVLSLPSTPIPLDPKPAVVVLPTLSPVPSLAPEIPGYRLAFASDFRMSRAIGDWNVVRWKYPYSGELQYYLPQNVRVAAGVLHITARRESYLGRAYTSGMVTTQGRFALLYGALFVRARLVVGQGLWPAAWMLPEQGGALPEIDIVEAKGSQPGIAWMSQHWALRPGYASDVHRLFQGPDFAAGFHTFGVIWTPASIIWTIDGVRRYARFDHIPARPMYLIMNLAVGGPYPGLPNAETPFPQTLEVKWVHAYALKLQWQRRATLGPSED